MKLVAVSAISLLLVIVVPESQAANLFTDFGKMESGLVKEGAETVRRWQTVGKEADKVTLGATSGGTTRLTEKLREKRSTLTMNSSNDVNAVDIAKTFNLDIHIVRDVFQSSDNDKNGVLKGQELLTFVAMIEETAGRSRSITTTKN